MTKTGKTGSISYVNFILIAVNAAIFLAGIVPGPWRPAADGFFARGALYAPLILKGQGFYRLVTAIFLHADAAHLTNNMIMQYAGGDLVERNLGHARYLLLYLVSGIGGNLASVLWDYRTGSYGYSVGASGAVFGVAGALVLMIFKEAADSMKKDPATASEGREGLSPGMRSLVLRAGFMIVWLLFSGWKNPVVNQAAHVGGLLCGSLLALVLMPRGRLDLSSLLR